MSGVRASASDFANHGIGSVVGTLQDIRCQLLGLVESNHQVLDFEVSQLVLTHERLDLVRQPGRLLGQLVNAPTASLRASARK